MSTDLDAVDTLWYVTGDEGCGEVSLKSCVVSEKRANTYFGGVKKPPLVTVRLAARSP